MLRWDDPRVSAVSNMIVFKALPVSLKERNQPISLATVAGRWDSQDPERMWLPMCAVCRGGRQEVLQGPLGSASAPTPQPRGQFFPLLVALAPLSLCGEQAQMVGTPSSALVATVSTCGLADSRG